MASWNNEDEMFALMKQKLYTPVVGDILDTMGYTHQFLPPEIRPMREQMKVAGKAMTVLMINVFEAQKKPFGLLTEALDQLEKNDVYLAAGASTRCAVWGELLTATARTRGAVGAVVHGWHRDTPQVLEQNWPVFSCGSYAQDSSVRTQVVDFRCTIEIGQAAIGNGDLVFGDVDGVLIIPGRVAEEVIEKSLEKAAGEKVVRKAIEDGMTATAAFAHFGIL